MASSSSSLIKINEEYAKIAPQLSESEFKRLKESIKADGLWLPIIVNQDGVLLDGHHRYAACRELAIEPRTMVRSFDNPLYEKLFVIQVNLRRRHLNDYQRTSLALKTKPILEEIARINSNANLKQNQKEVDSPSPPSAQINTIGRVNHEIGKRAGVGETTVRRVEKINSEASEEQKQRLESGRTSINKEYQKICNQERRQDRIESAKAITTTTVTPNGISLIHGDMIEKCKNIPDNSIDLIFTDPPYGSKDSYLYGDLAKVASRVLKPGGSLVTYCGHYTLIKTGNDVIESSAGLLKYLWLIPVIHGGGSSAMHAYWIRVKYKPLLIFVKGTYAPVEHIEDVIYSQPPDKSLHEWAQSPVEAEYVISKLTVENQVILDPFLGSGTTGIAALKLKRKFIGIEKNAETFEVAKARIALATDERHQRLHSHDDTTIGGEGFGK